MITERTKQKRQGRMTLPLSSLHTRYFLGTFVTPQPVQEPITRQLVNEEATLSEILAAPPF